MYNSNMEKEVENLKKYKIRKFDYEHQYELKWEEGKFETFTLEELISEDEKTAMVAIAKGFKVKKG
jgi:hypothetical protein